MIFLKIFFTSDCTASKDDGNCCTSSNPCALGQGDCDSDSQCAGDLVCGTDNCINFDSTWPSTSDCCTTGNKIIQLQFWHVMPANIEDISYDENDPDILHQLVPIHNPQFHPLHTLPRIQGKN